jgi:hypothetical protein
MNVFLKGVIDYLVPLGNVIATDVPIILLNIKQYVSMFLVLNLSDILL